MTEVKEIRSETLVNSIRALLDGAFDSINTTKQHGKTYRAEQECEILADVYKVLMKKFKVDSVHFRHYKLIAVSHIESIEKDLK